MNLPTDLLLPLTSDFASRTTSRHPAPTTAPMMLVQPGGFPANSFRRLAQKLAPRISLTVVDLDGIPEHRMATLTGRPCPLTVDEVAERIRAALANRGLFAAPMWLLSGWSFGGVIAYALYTALPIGERPRGLLLLDSVAPVPPYLPAGDRLPFALILPWFASYLGARSGRALDLPAQLFVRADGESGLRIVLDAALAAEALPPETTLPGLRKLFHAYVDNVLRHVRMSRMWQPRPTSGPITVVRPDRGLFGTRDALGWERLGDNVQVRWTSANHYSLLSDRVAIDAIADTALACLCGIRARMPS
ncbi:thioesterase domain-containing protein [Nocardia arthritidis]|uniref:Thioesterase domain-containing protein n=1 Tax=Nocardia arthritidis TaxID=228602 RepID=A0A6G9YM07_9NOCA|nr:thioesterase domain-containing protein [Nocardia arthritidis]QIS14066.1 hypothetical protein F5544_31120 [Nocardia arthritidis]